MIEYTQAPFAILTDGDYWKPAIVRRCAGQLSETIVYDVCLPTQAQAVEVAGALAEMHANDVQDGFTNFMESMSKRSTSDHFFNDLKFANSEGGKAHE